jgi:cytochrome b
MTTTASDKQISVWDPLVRFGHWALAAAFAIAYITGEEAEDRGNSGEWHEWAGYIAGGIVVWRVLWGLFGTQHARFSDFVTGPRTAIAYLFGLMGGHTKRYVGHSPAGGAMVVALLVMVAATTVTGIIADPEGTAPKPQPGVTATMPVQSGEARKAARSHEEREGRRGEEKESLIGEAHAVLANLTLFLVILHILGVALASYVHRENLARAMVTGMKRPEDEEA